MEDEKIKAVEQWSQPKLVRDIQVFLGFTNFYWRFILGFSRITAPLTLMLKTTENIRFIVNLKKTEGKIGGDSIVGNIVDGGEATNSIKRKNQAKIIKSKILVKSKNHDFLKFRTKKVGTCFFISEAKLAFT